MTQSNIKDEVQQLQQEISFKQDRLKYLRSICKHVNVFNHDGFLLGPKEGAFSRITCTDCGRVIEDIVTIENIHPIT